MKSEKCQKRLVIGMICGNLIIQDQGKEDDCDPYKGDQESLAQLFQPRFAVYPPICADQCIQDQPEDRYNSNTNIEVRIMKDQFQFPESINVERILSEKEKQAPGN